MRKLIWLLLLFCSHHSYSQSQDLKQLELDIEKLAQLKAMLSSMYSGYNMLAQQYSSIKNLSSQNFDLHKMHLDQMLSVSNNVRNYPKLRSIISLSDEIAAGCASAQQLVYRATLLTAAEKKTMLSKCGNILSSSQFLREELDMVSTPGRLRMEDAERLRAIDNIELSMKQKLVLINQQSKNITALIALRQKQHAETLHLKSMY